MNDIYIIAEAGVNHNGSRDMAFDLVDVAVNAGADAIKFQTFKSENLVTKQAGKAEYQKLTTDMSESQYEMLKNLELTYESHIEIKEYCEQRGIEFLSTAFDQDSLNFLVKKLGLKRLKIPSGEITNGPFLLEHAQTGCDLILSTGMASIEEVQDGLSVIAFGLLSINDKKLPQSKASFNEAFFSAAGQELLKQKVTLLHCTTEYPAPFDDINLSAMNVLRKKFGLNIGYSDHSEGIIVPIMASTLGATLIEKHFTLDKSLPGPDHRASLEPDELKSMIDAIRIVERALGDGKKEPRPSELVNREITRKSLVANTDIRKGEKFTSKNLTAKRPGTGISPMEYWSFLGKTSNKNYDADEQI